MSEELREFAGCFHRRSKFELVPPFDGKVKNFVQWAIFSEPRHPFLSRTLRNIVELVRKERAYVADVNANFGGDKIRWKRIVCTTGPGVFTASIREVVSEQIPGLKYRIVNPMFEDVGGVFKVFEREGKYVSLMDEGISLLTGYESRESSLRTMQRIWLVYQN